MFGMSPGSDPCGRRFRRRAGSSAMHPYADGARRLRPIGAHVGRQPGRQRNRTISRRRLSCGRAPGARIAGHAAVG